MKKFFTLALLALLSLTVQAQDKKTWDFTKGWSDATITDLQADNVWTKAESNGSTNYTLSTKGFSGEFKANGNTIKELVGITAGGISSKNGNNFVIFDKKFRLNRAGETLTFPSLKNGQILTIVGNSANAEKSDRGISPVGSNLVPIGDNAESDKMLGSKVEGSKGVYTFKWRVEASGDEAVEVTVKVLGGPLDCTLFMIDDGDPIMMTKVAYLYSGSTDGDKAFQYLSTRENTEVTAIDVASKTVTTAELQEYAITLIAASVPVDNANVAIVKEALPWTPTLNLNAGVYSAWGYGAAFDASENGSVKIAKSPVLTGVNIQEAGDEPDIIKFVQLQEGSDEPLKAIKLGDYFAGDQIPLNDISADGDIGQDALIHLHNANHNGYAYIPYTASPTEDWTKILENTVTLLAESKSEITEAVKPVIKQEFKDKNTNVTISAGRDLPKTRFFYTTDGTDPTDKSAEYTKVLNFTAPVTLKAVAIAEGYTLSEVTSLDILIHEQPKTPVIAAERADGKTTITLTCETPDVDIWYNFDETAGNDTLKSTKYTEPFVITMPQNVTAFSVAGGAVFSELTQKRVLVQNPRVVIDVAAHFSAPQWDGTNKDAKTVAHGKGMFSWGASAVTMYTGEGTLGTDPETGDEITIYTDADLRDFEVVEEPTKKISGDGEPDAWAEPEWVLKSRGTCLIWQNIGAQTTNFGDDSNYNPSASTDVDPLFPVTKNDIQFYKFQAGQPGNASIETLKKYQAPLDVVVLANMQGGPLLAQVSADGSTWQTIGEIKKTGYERMWGKYTHSYDGTDEVFVRVTQEVASGGAKVFDIYIANQGEKSKALLEDLNNELTGIETVADYKTKTTMGIYNINGIRQQTLRRGLNIVVNGDGTVKKVMVK